MTAINQSPWRDHWRLADGNVVHLAIGVTYYPGCVYPAMRPACGNHAGSVGDLIPGWAQPGDELPERFSIQPLCQDCVVKVGRGDDS